MRRPVVLIAACLLAACSKAPDGGTDAPAVNVTAAPGVAFTYAYLFTLPPAAIARTQEAHAQACERLGIARCRITGMTYNVRSPEDVDATLVFALDPTLARAFARQGIAAVEAADGMLSSAAIEGTDVASGIDAATTGQAADRDDAGRLEERIAAEKSGTARAELLRQRESLAAAARDRTAAIAAQRARLAQTPVTFNYASGDAIRSLRVRSPIARAADTALASLQETFSFALQAVALLLPPLALLALLWLAWRAVGRRAWRWLRGPDATG